MSAGLAAVNARRVAARALASLREEFSAADAVRVVAAGKAAVGMAQAASEALGDRLVEGVVTADVQIVRLLPDKIRFFPSSHPLPNDASEAAGRAALAAARRAAEAGELLTVCLSGGASAMLAVPAAGLTLEDKRVVNRELLRAGLDIGSMNVVRRHISAIKGGQLAAAAGRSLTLAISDVTRPVEDDPLTIGSGPTVGDDTTFDDALRVIEDAGLGNAMPAAVMAHLRAGRDGRVEGPVSSADRRLRNAAYWIVASRQDAMRAAAETARQLGYHVNVRRAPLEGEARLASPVLFDLARQIERPSCVISSGETTVRVTGQGKGGRNQELAVASLERLAQVGNAALASIGTDGVDGPTDAAGAMVDSGMWSALGPGAADVCAGALEQNDAYPLLERLDALVKTGPTGTNVCDLQVLLLL